MVNELTFLNHYYFSFISSSYCTLIDCNTSCHQNLPLGQKDNMLKLFNPFVANVPILYILKIPENLCIKWVSNGNIGQKSVNVKETDLHSCLHSAYLADLADLNFNGKIPNQSLPQRHSSEEKLLILMLTLKNMYEPTGFRDRL